MRITLATLYTFLRILLTELHFLWFETNDQLSSDAAHIKLIFLMYIVYASSPIKYFYSFRLGTQRTSLLQILQHQAFMGKGGRTLQKVSNL